MGGKQHNGDTSAMRVRPLHEMRIGRFHVGGERASRVNQSPDRDVL
ncbi:hypothetical protein XCR_0236 [Xanthomonas campestris pv. raphani 756C]|nr:hypothetical protein XCR_0236 [Xanthomonas campestris pv. raphani 756C]